MPLGRGSRWWLRCAGPGYVHSAQRLPLDRLRVVRCDLLSCVVGSEFSDPLVSDRGDTISARRTLPTGRGTDSEGLSRSDGVRIDPAVLPRERAEGGRVELVGSGCAMESGRATHARSLFLLSTAALLAATPDVTHQTLTHALSATQPPVRVRSC